MKLKIHFDNVNEHSANYAKIHGLWVRARLSICIIRLVDSHLTKHTHTHNTQAYIQFCGCGICQPNQTEPTEVNSEHKKRI